MGVLTTTVTVQTLAVSPPGLLQVAEMLESVGLSLPSTYVGSHSCFCSHYPEFIVDGAAICSCDLEPYWILVLTSATRGFILYHQIDGQIDRPKYS